MATGASLGQISPQQFCSECGRTFPAQDLVRFGSVAVCADCKPVYAQRIREGATTAGMPGAGTMQYAGFWIRVAAIILDSIIFSVAFGILGLLAFLVLPKGGIRFLPEPGTLNYPPGFWLMELGFGILGLLVNVFFISQKGGTPGKLILGLRIVTATGAPVGVGRAIGRVFAYYLSALILYIGFIIAAFDSEKRALHDHICGTRVIRV